MTSTAASDLFDLGGCVAVVSGASGWLGSAMVDALAQANAHVVAVGRNRDTLDAVAQAAAGHGGTVEPRVCDVATSQWPELVAAVAAEHGRLDVLVNNAHVGRGGSLRTATEENFTEAWDLAVRASWRGMEAARPGFAASLAAGGRPSVVNVASMYAMVAPDLAMYATEEGRNPPFYGAAKAGLLQLSRYAAAELGLDGVRVNVLTPGPFPQHPERMDPAFLDELARRTMLGRVGTPDDIRTALLFLASPRSAFVTGSNVVVDGGWTAR